MFHAQRQRPVSCIRILRGIIKSSKGSCLPYLGTSKSQNIKCQQLHIWTRACLCPANFFVLKHVSAIDSLIQITLRSKRQTVMAKRSKSSHLTQRSSVMTSERPDVQVRGSAEMEKEILI